MKNINISNEIINFVENNIDDAMNKPASSDKINVLLMIIDRVVGICQGAIAAEKIEKE